MARIITQQCDRCGAEFQETNATKATHVKSIDVSIMQHASCLSHFRLGGKDQPDFEVCENCTDKYKNLIMDVTDSFMETK